MAIVVRIFHPNREIEGLVIKANIHWNAAISEPESI